MIFIKTMINSDPVWIRRIRIEWFTLNIIKLKFFITIFSHDNWGWAYNFFFIWFKFLKSFELIMICQTIIINIIMEMRIIFKRLMPSYEWIIKIHVTELSSPQLFLIENKVWNNNIVILKQALMKSISAVCRSQAFVNSILMNSPHIFNSLIHIIIVSFPW